MTRVLLVLMALSFGCSAQIEMTRAELQKKLSASFPIEKGGALLSLILHDPEVLLTDGSEEIGIRMRISVGVGMMMSVPAGRLGVAGELSYDPESRTLLLNEPRIHTLELEGPAREREEDVRAIINRVVHEVLPTVPLKTIDGSAGWMLKSVTVRDGSVWAEVGL